MPSTHGRAVSGTVENRNIIERSHTISFTIPIYQGSFGKLSFFCHALVLVICVFFIILVRPGCDMGDLLCVVLSGGLLDLWGCVQCSCLGKSMVA